MPTFGADQSDRRVFGNEMRALREQKTWTQDDLACAMNYSLSTVKNLESGYRLPTRDQCAVLDTAFGLPGIFERMYERLRGLPLAASFRPFAPHEAEASTIKWFEHTLIPGLFQTEDYARVLTMAYPGIDADDVAELVSARMDRQAVLDRNDPPLWMWVVLDEYVLQRNIGGPEVMYAQLAKLAELATRPKITVQIISSDRPHLGLGGAFIIAENKQPPPVVYLEGPLVGQTLEDGGTADRLSELFETMRADALTRDASRTLIEEEAQRWKERMTP
ncbi:helix-turn-helix domain-containing protein [Actinophytocola sediminis]